MAEVQQKTARKPRADAQRNRARLLDAAREVFSAGGPNASLEAVAKTAGVGIGTLYRNFPTRESLFQAVYSSDVDELVVLADRLTQDSPPVEAIRLWLKASVRLVATKRGMVTALEPVFDQSDTFFSDNSARMQAALKQLMDRAVTEGLIRDDISAYDLMKAMLGMCYTRDQPGWQDTVPRLLDVFVDGMRV